MKKLILLLTFIGVVGLGSASQAKADVEVHFGFGGPTYYRGDGSCNRGEYYNGYNRGYYGRPQYIYYSPGYSERYYDHPYYRHHHHDDDDDD